MLYDTIDSQRIARHHERNNQNMARWSTSSAIACRRSRRQREQELTPSRF